ncbi:MAG: recombinase family protein [Rhodocyclaceae bacterium]|nr:recombinase family protein [Rhodocyclaceae bacterium]HNA86396.1 recombinase family protein [Nitrospira sp.]
MNKAALYLRSSKDRSDVSIDAQRRELSDLAKAKQLVVTEEFSDAVESGKDDQRPGFQALLRSLKDPKRSWDCILFLDTSRLARNQYLAHAFHFECERKGIKIIYAKVPETNTAMDTVIRAVMQAFDQLHSMMSREKGLAGMAENVKQGFRAGGRAPFGYKLEKIATGAIRDGEPVTKSRLMFDENAPKIGVYLKKRAEGVSRRIAADAAGLEQPASTLIGFEQNALVYAGHTVWNVNSERLAGGGYKGGMKRKPRSEWVIQHDTHEALISTEEAERLVAALERQRPTDYRTDGAYLLTGFLVDTDGKKWTGSGDGAYRLGKGKRIAQHLIESAVIERVIADVDSDAFVNDLLREAQKIDPVRPDERLPAIQRELNDISKKIGRCANLAAETDKPRVFLDQIEVLERKREALLAEANGIDEEAKAIQALQALTKADIRSALSSLMEELRQEDRDALKEALSAIVEKITLDSVTLACQITYRLATGEIMASPRGFEPRLPP